MIELLETREGTDSENYLLACYLIGLSSQSRGYKVDPLAAVELATAKLMTQQPGFEEQ